jgi:hypothetical protein
MSVSSDAERILHDLRSGNYGRTRHARQRMAERGVTDEDIRCCAETVRKITEQEGGKYRISGLDLSGDPLDLVAVWDGETVLISVIGD